MKNIVTKNKKNIVNLVRKTTYAVCHLFGIISSSNSYSTLADLSVNVSKTLMAAQYTPSTYNNPVAIC